MHVNGLLIPVLLTTMLAESRWPRDTTEANRQHTRSFVAEDRIRRFRKIYLYSPPFHTVAKIIAGEDRFYANHGALHELHPELAVEIGDFGLGSDSPILLDYRADPDVPRVLHLEWSGDGGPNYWVVMASDFAGFVEMLGL